MIQIKNVLGYKVTVSVFNGKTMDVETDGYMYDHNDAVEEMNVITERLYHGADSWRFVIKDNHATTLFAENGMGYTRIEMIEILGKTVKLYAIEKENREMGYTTSEIVPQIFTNLDDAKKEKDRIVAERTKHLKYESIEETEMRWSGDGCVQHEKTDYFSITIVEINQTV